MSVKAKDLELESRSLSDDLPPADPNADIGESEAPKEAGEYDEYGNIIVKVQLLSEKELAAKQAVYPQNILFTQ